MSERAFDYGKERIPDSEFVERLQKVQQGLKKEGLAVGLAYATEHMPGDVQYLTGYDPHIENVALLVLPNRLVLLGGAEAARRRRATRENAMINNRVLT